MRNRQDGLEESAVLQEGLEGCVLCGSTLPWVTTASQVNQNDAERPDVVRGRRVARKWLWIWLLALCGKLLAIVISGKERRQLSLTW